jgi:hypothetical protein
MMNWLVGDFQVFGLVVQNWMLLIGGGFVLYIAVLVIAGRQNGRVR